MKKFFKGIILVVVALIMSLAFVACDGTPADSNSGSGSNSGTNTPTKTTNATVSEESLKNILGDGKLYATTIGQADLSTVNNLLKLIGFSSDSYTSEELLNASDVEEGSTVIIVVGMSNKGLGSAGTSQAQEEARAEAFAAKTGINVIALHVGGKDRRGEASDGVIKTVVGAAKVALVVDDGVEGGTGGDYDNMITNRCAEKSVPLYLFTKSSQMQASLKFLLGK